MQVVVTGSGCCCRRLGRFQDGQLRAWLVQQAIVAQESDPGLVVGLLSIEYLVIVRWNHNELVPVRVVVVVVFVRDELVSGSVHVHCKLIQLL